MNVFEWPNDNPAVNSVKYLWRDLKMNTDHLHQNRQSLGGSADKNGRKSPNPCAKVLVSYPIKFKSAKTAKCASTQVP